jgi:hypothetical protein
MPVIGAYKFRMGEEHFSKLSTHDFLYTHSSDKFFHLDSNVLQLLFTQGNNAIRNDIDIILQAVPYQFRHAFKSKICHKSIISINKYVMFKLAKYEEKQNLNFEKLIRKRNALEIYLRTNDVYFEEFNKYLSRRLFAVNNHK